MISLCLVYFRSVTLAHLAAALHAIRRQDLRSVAEVIVLDNNTEDDVDAIRAVVAEADLPVPVCVVSCKHGNPDRTHAWSTNAAVRDARNRGRLLGPLRRDQGIEVQVLSARDEARFGVLAALDSASFVNGMVLDLGGSSLQLSRIRRRRGEVGKCLRARAGPACLSPSRGQTGTTGTSGLRN